MSQQECQEKTCIILIGSSGVGKSTLTNILSTANTKISNSSNSCTKDCTIFDVNYKPTLMDTPGFEDSDKSFSDTEVIKLMTTKLGRSKSPKIKILWCIRVCDKMVPNLQLQAKLINALGNNIWGSVLIVCKKADMDEPESNWRGAITAASKYYSETIPCLGIHNVSVLKEKVQEKYKKRNYKSRTEDDDDEYYAGGHYFSGEIKEVIFNKLSNLPSTKAKLRKVYYHASTSLAHRYSWSSTAISYTTTGCPECRRDIDCFTWEANNKLYKDSTWYCHTRGCNRKFYEGDTYYHCWPCCDRSTHSNDVFKIGCRGLTCSSCVRITKYRGGYSCCNSTSSTGCVTSCCGRNPNSNLTQKCGEIKYEPKGL